MNYPNHPGSRQSAPETSFQAAEAVKESASAIRERVLGVLSTEHVGFTCHELADKLWVKTSGTAEHERFRHSVQSRLSELLVAGKVIQTPLRRKNSSGVFAVAWRAASFRLSQPNLL
jgi:hypothetical protein